MIKKNQWEYEKKKEPFDGWEGQRGKVRER